MIDLRRAIRLRRRSYAEAVAELIEEHLPPLQAKIRRRRLPELARRIVERESDPDLFFAATPPLRLAATLLHTRHVLPVIEQEHEALVDRQRRFVRLHDALPSDRAKRRYIEDHLRRTASSWRKARGDLIALDRNLDLGALRERHDALRHPLVAAIELGLDFVGTGIAKLGELDHPDTPAALSLLRASDIGKFVLDRMMQSPRWQTRLVAGRATVVLAKTLGHLGEHELAELRQRTAVPDEHPWVQAAAVDALWVADAERARQVSEDRLAGPSPTAHKLDFLVRRLLVDRLPREPAWGLHVLDRLVARQDPSEHVRVGICEALRQLAVDRPEALAILGRLLPGPVGVGDPSPTIRAHAMRVLLVSMSGLMRRPDVDAQPAVDLLLRAIDHERDELPLRLCCEDLRVRLDALADDPNAHRDLERLAPLTPLLVEISARAEVSAAVHESAAATLESLDRALDPERREVTRWLRQAVERTPVGGQNRIPLPAPDALDAAQRLRIGRALAELTRADWGIDASLRAGALTIYRGDQYTTKLWRVLHELRTPGPNKRQGFRHTVGRILRGELRAPSGRLDEVTPTVVPGERVQIPAESSWARHVPGADDALSVPVLRDDPVEIYSSFGITTMRSKAPLLRRLAARLRLVSRYAKVAAQRSVSLSAKDPEERGRYAALLERAYDIEVRFTPYPPTAGHPRRVPERLRALMPSEPPPSAAWLAPLPVVPEFEQWLQMHAHYFLSMSANDQNALATFLLGAFAVFFGDSFRRRVRIDRARAKIPLSIGGWGTRGKSGTERLKAGLFHGLGYQVFSKTTGCEAMMIHSIPEGPASEVFVFRPYSKATIWEQRNLLELGAALGADVFLWECMALNPKYVEVLQHNWMRDDLVTLTNAYPDHEDIQGPAGINVADVISRFVPRKGTLIHSEINFSPLFEEAARKSRTKLTAIGDFDGQLLPRDLLDLFPYQEHPRNIALVTKMAEELGMDRELAIVTMAQHVVPDLGVLKTYPAVRMHGRVMEFINGCSANERAGFMANWLRTGCSALADSDDPAELVITVVNNRDDRISRSEVFARILVNDAIADRHVLIGTNLRGLVGYMRNAMDVFAANIETVRPKELEESDGAMKASERLARLMNRLRIPRPDPEPLLQRLRTYAAGAGHEVADEAPIRTAIAEVLASEGSLEFAKVRQDLAGLDTLTRALEASLREAPAPAPLEPPEVLAPSDKADVVQHFVRQLARSTIHARLQRLLEQLFETKSASGIAAYEDRVREAYRLMFEDMIVVVEDPKTKGDAIIRICARAVPPGTHVRLMGTQNIKGTGLDFVYRWLAIGFVVDELAILRSVDLPGRLDALARLEGFEDHGLCDLGILRAFLRRYDPSDANEKAASARLLAKADAEYDKRKAALGALGESKPQADASASSKSASKGKVSSLEKFLGWTEGWLDFLDGARRYHEAAQIMRDLVDQRISHPKAAVLMREIYAREKGGWLIKKFSRTGP